jgi:hypothetical protein
MFQAFIDEGSLPFGKGCQIRNTSIQIPGGASVAENLKHAIVEDQQARAAKHAHHQARGRKEERIRQPVSRDLDEVKNSWATCSTSGLSIGARFASSMPARWAPTQTSSSTGTPAERTIRRRVSSTPTSKLVIPEFRCQQRSRFDLRWWVGNNSRSWDGSSGLAE